MRGPALRRFVLVAAGLTGLALSACASLDASTNSRPNPTFALEDYFQGETRAYGVFEDRAGKVLRTFSVVAKGKAAGDTFVLDERFLWSDGERQSRTWTFKRIADGRYEGRAGDVKGVATLETQGDAMRLRYTLNLPYKGGTLAVRFDDWSHLVADGVAINRADVSKFGVKLGRVTLTFIKPDQAAPVTDSLRTAF